MTRIVTTHYRYKRPLRKRKAVALAAGVLMMCGGHTARAERTIHCEEGKNFFHLKTTDEMTIRQKEDGYEVNGHPVKSIFEMKDRRQAVLYIVRWDDDASAQNPLAGSPVLIITVDFQTPSISTFQVPLGGDMSLPNPHDYEGCARLD
jgi:hypothetical protein